MRRSSLAGSEAVPSVLVGDPGTGASIQVDGESGKEWVSKNGVRRSATRLVCNQCEQEFLRANAEIAYRLKKGIGSTFCSMKCAGAARRDTRTLEEKVSEKSAYDAEYRAKNRAILKAKKREARLANPLHKEREKAQRAKRMPKHVEYCRRPEYRVYKEQYDRRYRAIKDFGPEFADAALTLLDIDREVEKRITRTQIYATNGTLNKSQERKRDYARTNCN